MASKSKTYSKEKLAGKVYTPEFIVDKILDDVRYNSSTILGKTILDPSCGDGRFLIAAVKRIIKHSNKEMLLSNLHRVYGYDIDTVAIEKCKENLNNLIKDFNIVVDWNIFVFNPITEVKNISQKFDYIVGNPPYIRIQHLDEIQRKYIQANYYFCNSGSTDIYIAFFELCGELLSENGICGLITPNTYFYSETAKALRGFFALSGSLLQITNYEKIQLFDNVSTYSAITIFSRKLKTDFLFQQATSKTEFNEKRIDIQELSNQMWQLTTDENIIIDGTQLKNIAKIHVGLTTLCDRAYIFSIETIDDKYVYAKTKFGGLVIEQAILKPIIKVSKLKNSTEPIKEYILFPFNKINGKHKIMAEDELSSKFPLAYQYLLSIKEELSKRDNGKPIIPWYNFGRNQSLDNSFGKKILFSPINKEPNFIYSENEDATFYSGYCIKYDGDVNALLQQLNSQRMKDFIEISSRDFRGGWKGYNKKVVGEFSIE